MRGLAAWLKMKTTHSAIVAVVSQGIKLIPASPEIRAFLESASNLIFMAVVAYLCSNVGEQN